MSVPEGAREDNKFTLPVKAEELAEHTLRVTKNEKVFLPQYQREITDVLNQSAINAYLLIREANDVRVRKNGIVDQAKFRQRLMYQEQAIRYLRRMLPMIDLARRVFHLSTRKVKFWAQMVIDVRDRTKSWMEDDMRRYSE